MEYTIPYKTQDELKAMTNDEITAYNQELMTIQDEIQEKKLEAKGEINKRAALERLGGLTEEQKIDLAKQIIADAETPTES
jgi:hypothetical protein